MTLFCCCCCFSILVLLAAISVYSIFVHLNNGIAASAMEF